jgi:signal transduction histidine kinase
MQSNDAFRHAEKDQEVEIQALESSMSAMKQVLDDVLDLQRMDSGKFTLKHEPFPFHTIVQASWFLRLRADLAADLLRSIGPTQGSNGSESFEP